jgi:predicted nucleic acid-binding protein
MSDQVIDSSVVAKWVLPEPDSGHARQLLSDAAGSGERLIVLDLALTEVTNAIWRQYHRRMVSLPSARVFLTSLLHLPVHLEPSNRLVPEAFEIAARYERSIYDALFVAMARDLGLPGLTADEPLFRAVRSDFPEIMLLRDWQP